MPYVEIEGLGKQYPGGFELKDVSFSLERGEIYTLMGPSGSGKTSLLRNICGLDKPDCGRIVVDGRDVTSVTTTKRGIGLIFQDLALFPHMRVYDNIAFGLRATRRPEGEIRTRVMELSELLKIEGMLQRYPSEVSGGQRQRVALARSVASSPSLLLLDEPLSSLDQQLRADVRSELKSFARELGLTMVYVTHDHHEGLYMADRAGAIFDGRLEKDGSPAELFSHPANEKIARFFGYNVVTVGGKKVAFYPSDFEFTAGSAGFPCTVRSVGFEGEFFRAHVQTERGENVQLTVPLREGEYLEAGDKVRVAIRRMEKLP